MAALVPADALAVFVGAALLGIVHGAEPGHGWPVAAAYALNRGNRWLSGLVAGLLIGLGHLVSSLAVVAVFFLAKSRLDLARLDAPIELLGVRFGGPVSVVAGVLLIALGVREYRRGHDHAIGDSDGNHGHDGHEYGHDHGRDHDHPHEHSHDHGAGGPLARLRGALPFVGGTHRHPTEEDLDARGLGGIVWTAFVLGFAHEEEFEIIGLCLGSPHCLALMLTYAVAVMLALVALTMLLIAGYSRYGERVELLAAHFPTISAAVLVAMGAGFVLGLL